MKFTKKQKAEFAFVHRATLNGTFINELWSCGRNKKAVKAVLMASERIQAPLRALERHRK